MEMTSCTTKRVFEDPNLIAQDCFYLFAIQAIYLALVSVLSAAKYLLVLKYMSLGIAFHNILPDITNMTQIIIYTPICPCL